MTEHWLLFPIPSWVGLHHNSNLFGCTAFHSRLCRNYSRLQLASSTFSFKIFLTLGTFHPKRWSLASPHSPASNNFVLNSNPLDLILIAIDNGKDRMVYAGPVFSHYEFETPNAVRRTNGEWHEEMRTLKHAARPAWTRSFVVPGLNPDAKDYGKTANQNGGKRGE